MARWVLACTSSTPVDTDGRTNGTGVSASFSFDAVASITRRVLAGFPPAAFLRTAPMGWTVVTSGVESRNGPPTAPMAISRANSVHAPRCASLMG